MAFQGNAFGRCLGFGSSVKIGIQMHWQPPGGLGSPSDAPCHITTLSLARYQCHIPGLLSLHICEPKEFMQFINYLLTGIFVTATTTKKPDKFPII